MQGAQFPDKEPFLAVAASMAPPDSVRIEINFNKLNQVQKAKIALATIRQLAILAKESLTQICPAPDSLVGLVIPALSDISELADKLFDVLQPPDAPQPPPLIPPDTDPFINNF
jgi:hypothetical protein